MRTVNFGSLYNLHYFHPPLPSFVAALKTDGHRNTVAVKTSSLVGTGGDQMGLKLPKSLIPRTLSVFDLYGEALESTIHRNCLSLP